jgi:hypothetical protein
MIETVPQTSPSDTQIRQRMHGMQCMHAYFYWDHLVLRIDTSQYLSP